MLLKFFVIRGSLLALRTSRGPLQLLVHGDAVKHHLELVQLPFLAERGTKHPVRLHLLRCAVVAGVTGRATRITGAVGSG